MRRNLTEGFTHLDFLLISTSVVIGCVGLSSDPALSASILAVPVLGVLASSRCAAFAVMLVYNLAVSRGLSSGVAVFLSENHTSTEAACLWLVMVLGVSLPFGLLWSGKPLRKAGFLVLAFLVAYVVPPLSLIGIVNPLMATGAVLKGWGFGGLLVVMAMYVICAASRLSAIFSLFVITAFTILPSREWHATPMPEGVIVVDTSFGRLGSGSFSFARDYERANMVFAELRKRIGRDTSADVVVLPETIAGRLNRTGLELWREEIERTVGNAEAVLFGAELPTGDGRRYDNALVMLHRGDFTFVPQRIPVPYSMYRGPCSERGANLHLADNGILELPDGRRAAVVICYEAFLTWPYLVSMIRKPDLIISISNLWWCRETSLPVSQKRAASLWANLFGLPVAFAWNI